MLRNKRESVEWLEFELFQEFPQVSHAVFLKHGGVSQAPYHSLNVGGGTGDDFSAIKANRLFLNQIMKCSTLVEGHQVHGRDLREVPFQGEDQCDGLYTAQAGIGLLIKHADCQAAIVYDPTQNVIANVHAGWRGNVQNIYESTVSVLQKRYGCKAENLYVGISPSLGPCCAQFINYKTEIPEHLWGFQIKPFYFDLWEMARKQWTESGVLSSHIQIAGICTCCNQDDYFSYRRDKITGRHATIILKKQKIE